MSNFHHTDMGHNGAVRNVVSVSDEGEIVARDIQTPAELDRIKDSCAQARNEYDITGQRTAYGYIAARVPIVIWQNWRREWQQKYRNDWTWQTFEVMKLNSRDFSYLRTTDCKIGTPHNVRTATGV